MKYYRLTGVPRNHLHRVPLGLREANSPQDAIASLGPHHEFYSEVRAEEIPESDWYDTPFENLI